MSVDGRDESLGGGGSGGDAGGLTSPQVPSQREAEVPAPSRGREPADGELLARLRAGDDGAYEELYRRHADAVRRYARTCCRDADTADDLTAEVFAGMLQAVRGGSGPEYAVRPYLLTSVRRVAARWTRSARREQLVDDFAVFAAQAAATAAAAVPGADVRAMHEAEQSMAMRAFRSLPERWQAVLWHTEVEDESPSEVAPLFGLDANGTRVLASRAREGLRQAYLQAHVSDTLAADEECARHVDQLGTYARRKLRVRAERGLRKHLEECARCRLAVAQIEEVAGGIPAVVPVAVIGWFGAAGYGKVLGIVAGSAAVGAGAAAGAGSSGSAGGSAGGAVSGAVKVGVAVGVVAAGAAVVALVLMNDKQPERDTAGPSVSPSAVPSPSSAAPRPAKKQPVPGKPFVAPASAAPAPAPRPRAPATTPAPTPRPDPEPGSKPSPAPESPAAPTPTPAPAPNPPSTPRPAPVVYQWRDLSYDVTGDGTRPEMRLAGSGWVWRRHGLSVGDTRYARGVTVHGSSSVTVDLNRECSAYDAMAGVDDLTLGTLRLAEVRFAVYADGVPLWRSGTLKDGDPAVPVHVDLTGHRTVRLVVEPLRGALDSVALADWAESRFTCE